MREIGTKNIVVCIAFCGAGCLACIGDGPVIIADVASGGTVLASGSAA